MRAGRLTAVTIVAWTVIALVSTAELYMYSQRSPHPSSFGRALASQVPGWVIWALATADRGAEPTGAGP